MFLKKKIKICLKNSLKLFIITTHNKVFNKIYSIILSMLNPSPEIPSPRQSIPTSEKEIEHEIQNLDIILFESQRSSINQSTPPRNSGVNNGNNGDLPTENTNPPLIFNKITLPLTRIDQSMPLNSTRGFNKGDNMLMTNSNYGVDSPPKETKIELHGLPAAFDLHRESTIQYKKKLSIFNPPSLVIDFIFKADKQKSLKLQILFVKFLLPHIVATIFTYCFMRFHIYVDQICWLGDKCDCHDNFMIKLYIHNTQSKWYNTSIFFETSIAEINYCKYHFLTLF